MKLSLITALGAALLTPALPANATTFKPIYKGVSLVMTGAINPGDADRLAAVYDSTCRKYRGCPERIFLNSNGGDLAAGIAIAGYVHGTGLHTVVGKTDTCLSSCFTVFAAGVHRVVFPTSRIGVHSASNQHGYESAGSLSATRAMAGFMQDTLHVPPSIITKMLMTPADDMAVLNWSDLAGWVELLRK